MTMPARPSPTLMLILACTALSGCTVGPDYRAPDLSTPRTWIDAKPGDAMAATAPDASRATAEPADVQLWWTKFNDAMLNWLVEKAGGANLDLRQAEARIRQARAQRIIAGAPLYPTVDATGDYRRSI